MDKDLIHPNFRVVKLFPYSFLRGNVILHLLHEEGTKHILVKVG